MSNSNDSTAQVLSSKNALVEAVKAQRKLEMEKRRGYAVIHMGEDGEMLSHYRRWKDRDGMPVNVPVIDVRDGVVETLLARSIEKSSNKSKWINYNQYHVSPKKRQTI